MTSDHQARQRQENDTHVVGKRAAASQRAQTNTSENPNAQSSARRAQDVKAKVERGAKRPGH